MILESTLTCPACGHMETETMPTNVCLYFYECKAYGTMLKPNPDDCCVFCSFGDVPCPPKQLGIDPLAADVAVIKSADRDRQ